MVCEAIIKLNKGRTGASLPAIKKYMEENYELPESYGPHLKKAIQSLLEKEKLLKVKASYKLDPNFRKSYMKENHIVVEKKEKEESEEESEEKKALKEKKKKEKKEATKEKKAPKEKKEKKEKKKKEEKAPRVAKPTTTKKKNLKESSKVEGPRTADRSKKQAASARTARAKARDKARED